MPPPFQFETGSPRDDVVALAATVAILIAELRERHLLPPDGVERVFRRAATLLEEDRHAVGRATLASMRGLEPEAHRLDRPASADG